MSKFLYEVQQKNRLKQEGLLRRFSISCYGHQETLEEMRAHKTEKYKELKEKGNREEFQRWFLNYKPDDLRKKTELLQKNKNKTNKNKTTKSKTTKTNKSKTNKSKTTKSKTDLKKYFIL
jgi:hypothetical protein